MWFAPPRPHSKRIRYTRVHEGVAVRLAGSLIRACHHGISFALLDEVKEGFTGKLLFDGLCLTGLISRACAGNQSAKSHSNSEGFHWLPPFLGRDTILIAGDDPQPFRAGNWAKAARRRKKLPDRAVDGRQSADGRRYQRRMEISAPRSRCKTARLRRYRAGAAC